MMPDIENQQERDKRALDLAEARGRRQQIVDGQLEDHDRQLKRINASIDGFSTRLAALERVVGESSAVGRELQKKTLDNRTFFIGVALVLVAVISLFLSSAPHS